jgi:hypothetical protein
MKPIIASSISSVNETVFKVYYRHNQTLIAIKFHDTRLRVEEIIKESIAILSDQYMLKLSDNYLLYALFPANRSGEKVNDAIEISHRQRIRGTGVKKFYLEYLNFAKETISTQINLEKKYGF